MNTLTLDSVIREILIQEGKDSLHNYKRYEQLAIGVLRELHYNVDGINKTARVEVTANGVGNLPEDFIKESRVCIQNALGELIDLTPNKNISIHDNNDNCNTEEEQSYIGGIINYNTAHVVDGQVVGRFYGLGGRNMVGEYRIDRTHNVITISHNYNYDYVILEYISNFQLFGGDIVIDPRSIDVIKLGVYAKGIALKRYIGRGEKDAANRAYESAKMNYNIALRMPTPSAILDRKRKTFKLSPKF